MKDQVISPFQLVHDLLIWPLNEPQKHRYLLGWRIQPTSDGNDFKIVFVHGEKFQSEFPAQKEQSPSPQIPTDTPKPLDTKVDLELLHQLMKRGVTERVSISPPKRPKARSTGHGPAGMGRSPGLSFA
jgi:hypothetical protein